MVFHHFRWCLHRQFVLLFIPFPDPCTFCIHSFPNSLLKRLNYSSQREYLITGDGIVCLRVSSKRVHQGYGLCQVWLPWLWQTPYLETFPFKRFMPCSRRCHTQLWHLAVWTLYWWDARTVILVLWNEKPQTQNYASWLQGVKCGLEKIRAKCHGKWRNSVCSSDVRIKLYN